MSVAAILVRRQSPTVTVYRPQPDGVGPHGEQIRAWEETETAVMEIQITVGNVRPDAPGQQVSGKYPAFTIHGVDWRQGDGIIVDTWTHYPQYVGRRFIVDEAFDWGPRGGRQGVLVDTDEEFGPGAST
jgi:hypothetical protein